MKVSARRRLTGSYQHDVKVRQHFVSTDEPRDSGGDDSGPSPQELLAASLASCTAITMEMYAAAQGLGHRAGRGRLRVLPAERGCPTRFKLVLRLPDGLSEEQVERLHDDRRQVPGPPHARRRGHVRGARRARLPRPSRASAPRRALTLGAPEHLRSPRWTLARGRAALAADRRGGSRRTRRPRPHRRRRARPGLPRRRDHELHAVFTRRRDDLRRHAGEISFPGGRQDDDEEDLRLTALREAEEEIGLPPAGVEIVGGLQPTPTVVTNYAIYPFVGAIEPGLAWTVSAAEVAEVLELPLRRVRDGYQRRRLLRRGVPFRTDVYVVDDHLIWGATARIVSDLIERLEPVLEPRRRLAPPRDLLERRHRFVHRRQRGGLGGQRPRRLAEAGLVEQPPDRRDDLGRRPLRRRGRAALERDARSERRDPRRVDRLVGEQRDHDRRHARAHRARACSRSRRG